MRSLHTIATILLVVGHGGCAGASSTVDAGTGDAGDSGNDDAGMDASMDAGDASMDAGDASMDAGDASVVGDAGVDGDAGEPACPTSADGCNMVVGTIGGESFVVTHACPGFGAADQTVFLTNYAVDSRCVATMAAEPADRALELQYFDVAPPTFVTSYWYPTGPSGGRTESTSGTAVMDVWDVPSSRMRGLFDLQFDGDHVCGCFDAVTP